MKEKFKKYLVDILAYESKKILAKFEPKIIAITGNIGKTTTKDYLGNILDFEYGDETRSSKKSENSEFGVALTIFGMKNPWGSVGGWVKLVTVNFLKILRQAKYPKILVLEVGADKPGDIKHITEFVRPNTVVLTAFQNTPTHGEFFSTIKQHIREKKFLVDALVPGGNIVYNGDDEIMTEMSKSRNDVNKYSFGKNPLANVQILESQNLYNSGEKISGVKTKFRVNINDLDEIFEIEQLGVLGVAQNYSLAAGILTALLHNMDLPQIVEAAKVIEKSKSRMRILNGKNNSIIIDDSYNSSPEAFRNGVEAVSKVFVKGKKILVLGHMAELGEKTREAHILASKLAAQVGSILVLVGRYNDFFLEGLREIDFDPEKIFLAKDATEAIELFQHQDLLQENDLVFIKGSQSARLEKLVVDILKHEEDREEVCRQDDEWRLR